MAKHYYNAEVLNKFGDVGKYQKQLADKFFASFGEIIKDSAFIAKEKSSIDLGAFKIPGRVGNLVQVFFC